ncbi:hypothetical protein NE664_06955 [Anaerotignum faecicola]|nr:hypothetical protein [Anaerotignum faecicola]
MDFNTKCLFNSYCSKMKKTVSFELCRESPYYDFNFNKGQEPMLRKEYVNKCVEASLDIWNECGFSEELVILYEDIYGGGCAEEILFLEKCIKIKSYYSNSFLWEDDGEKYKARRHIWRTDSIDAEKIFKKIILSDISGGRACFSSAVYIIESSTENVFFLYDDRGADVFSCDERYLKKLGENLKSMVIDWQF